MHFIQQLDLVHVNCDVYTGRNGLWKSYTGICSLGPSLIKSLILSRNLWQVQDWRWWNRHLKKLTRLVMECWQVMIWRSNLQINFLSLLSVSSNSGMWYRKKVKSCGIQGQIHRKMAKFTGISRGICEANFTGKRLVKNDRLCGSILTKFHWKAIGFALIWGMFFVWN